jgi:hypothetical protein
MVILMFKPLKTLVFLLFCLSSSLVSSQSIDGLQEIVKLQQDKISIIEDNLKKLIGSIEEKSDSKNVLNSNNKEEYKVANKPEIKQEGLNAKKDGILGYINETDKKEKKTYRNSYK